MKYKIQLKRSVVKTLKSLPQKEIRKIGKKIDCLEQNPIPKDSKKIKGEKGIAQQEEKFHRKEKRRSHKDS